MGEESSKKKEFLEAYDRYSPAILRHIYFRINNWELAEDLTQETFLKTWTYIAGSKGKIDNLKTFMFRVAHNLIVDHYRRKPRMPISIENVDPDKVKIEAVQESQANAVIEMDLMKKSLQKLDENHRQIITYRYIDDLSIEEIEKITERSANNISVMLHRALKNLKEGVKYGRANENN